MRIARSTAVGCSPARTSATAAIAVLTMLNAPGRALRRDRSAIGPRRTNVAGSLPSTITRQSADRPGSDASVVTGTAAWATRRTPQSSSTHTSPWRERSGVNSDAFAAK